MDPHPGHGPQDPRAGVPARIPGSIRRTSTVDCHWPDGLSGDVTAFGSARDLLTDQHGFASVITEASMTVEIAYQDDRKILDITTAPAIAGLQTLIGATSGPGFRRRMVNIASKEREGRSALHLLLDDIPVAVLVAAYAFNQAGRSSHKELGFRFNPDQCSGWANTGTMMQAVRITGRTPRINGPHAPNLVSDLDPVALHDLHDLPPQSSRRLRRLDVSRVDGDLMIDAMFRDSYMSPTLNETVVHEYGIQAKVNKDLVVTDVLAQPRVLPWEECPAAADSASTIVGHKVNDLRNFVRANLSGTSTCTHLNDLLRSLDDVVALNEFV